MMPLTCCPDLGAPLDWQAIDERFAWIRRMRGVVQDPIHHAEGDVWTHVRMVCRELIGDPVWRGLAEPSRRELFAAALLHDVAKPDTTKVGDDGRVSARGHARRGAIMARRILWEAGADVATRERICALVRHHLVPMWLVERDDAARLARRISLRTSWQTLVTLARADARGRICRDRQELLSRVALAGELADELGCGAGPYPFPSDHTRVCYFRDASRAAEVEAYDDSACTMTIMVGLPATGKDTWLETRRPDLPVVSLDAIRQELGLDPGSSHGSVIQLAQERAREHLRAHRDFAWNATNISRLHRDRLTTLALNYHARIEMIVVETDPQTLDDRNRARDNPVPPTAIDRMIDKWEMPDGSEAHRVLVVET